MYIYKALGIKLDEKGVAVLQSFLDDGWEPVRETSDYTSIYDRSFILCILRKAKS